MAGPVGAGIWSRGESFDRTEPDSPLVSLVLSSPSFSSFHNAGGKFLSTTLRHNRYRMRL